jgi:hypothetical protein
MIRIVRGTFVAILTLAIVVAGCGGKPRRGHYEQAGGFSYDPPKGWQITQFPGLKYRISHGPAEHEFAPNINVLDESFVGSLAEYVDLNLGKMKDMFTGFTLLKREDFQTEDGLPGTRLVVEDKQQGRALRQTFCFFSNSTRKYVVTCTALAEGGESLDGLFAQSMRTFRVH